MENKQTAVEWLEFEINRRGPKEDNPPQWLKELYEQAKAMEKEQITEAYTDGWLNRHNGSCTKGDDYYKETYGGENE
jgi:hypothetical protein